MVIDKFGRSDKFTIIEDIYRIMSALGACAQCNGHEKQVCDLCFKWYQHKEPLRESTNR